MENNKVIFTTSEVETEKIGEELAKKLSIPSVILLEGNLGAGKTVFARGFARGLGITEPLSSPTYTIVQEYEIPNNKGRLYHLDLYRISGVNAALGFGIDEFLCDKRAICLVEWPERIETMLPDSAIKITIEHQNETSRKITISTSYQ